MTGFRILTATFLMLIAASVAEAEGTKKAAQNSKMQTDRSRDVLPFDVTEKTLPNGLKVIVVPTGFPNLVSLQIPVQTGSRNEVEPGKSGFAHFFEHMMFRGTKAFPPDAYQAMITKAGARQNAYTSDDVTNYHVTFAKEDLETMLKIEADRFQSLSYPEDAFKTEARAVLGEYNKNSANPISKLLEVQREAAYSTHTYKHTTMGFVRDIEDMPNQYEYSKVFFDRWYRPERTTIIVAGDVKASEVLPLVQKYWGKWKRGSFSVEIPKEPEPTGPVYAHVPWQTETLPWVTVAFHGPAFSDRSKDFAAISGLLDLYFGSTSEIYKKLVEKEQKVDQLFSFTPPRVDSALMTIGARVKNQTDALYVRDEILRTVARLRTEVVEPQRLDDAKANARYGLLRSLDNTEAIADTLVDYVYFDRSFDTINAYFRLVESLEPEDLLAAAQKYLTDSRMVITTLSQQPMPEAVRKAPSLASFATEGSTSAANANLNFIIQKTPLPQLNMKLLFDVGSAYDPKGKEGLAALSASMVTEAGSRSMRYDEITKALFPVAGSFNEQVDKEMTTFTGIIHRDNWKGFLDVTLPQLLEPGLREEDFSRIRDNQLNALRQDLRSNNEEELGKEHLQAVIFRGTPYQHPVIGTVSGIESITIDDVKNFIRTHYTQGNLRIGVAGDAPEELVNSLRKRLGTLPVAATSFAGAVKGTVPRGMVVEIIEKETRATAISFGHPIEVTRSHPDFVALTVARAWLGEHRSSVSHLYSRIREERGMNYGDYAYIEAFPRGGSRFFPDANIARRAQIFEVWIRPVVPVNAHMALRIATFELEKLVSNGLSKEAFESTRDYLMKNVYVMTATQNQQIGYALDSDWYGIGEFTGHMRERLQKLTLEDVNGAIRKHLSPTNLAVVVITKDAKGLKDALIADGVSTIAYDAAKSEATLAEDKVIGARKLNIRPENVTIIPVGKIFQ